LETNVAETDQDQIDVPKLVQEAAERTKDYLSPTPLEFSRYLSDQIDGEVWLKLDLVQRTASFKYRGAINKILSLTEEELDRGVVSASTGNYALAVAEAMRQRGRRATIYIAEDMEESRKNILESHGLDLIVSGELAWDAEAEARRVGEEEGKVYVSPYNDPMVVAGQGTCGYEVSKQLPDLDAIFLACGAGGLLTGSSGWLKHHNPAIDTYGVSPANSPVMYESLRQGKMISWIPK
jgi:threonine dehydratase